MGNTIDGLTAEEWFEKGRQYMDLSDFESSVESFTKSIKLSPNRTSSYFNRGFSNGRLKLYNKAIEDYTKVIQFNPIDELAYLFRGCSKDDLKLYREAIEDFSISIQLNHAVPDTYYNRGGSKASLKLYHEAIEDYNIAIQLNPDYVDAYNNRGVEKNLLKLHHEAIEDYNIAIQLNPKFTRAYINRGVSKDSLKLYCEAIEDYNFAIQLDPEFIGAYINRGHSKDSLKLYHEAIEDFNFAIQLNTDYVEAYHYRGYSKGGLNLYHEAINDFSIAIRLNPDYAQAYFDRGRTYSQLLLQGEFECETLIFANLLVFYRLSNRELFIECFSTFQSIFKENQFNAPLLLQEIIESYGDEVRNWYIDPYWQNVLDDCQRPNLFITDLENDKTFDTTEREKLLGLVYYLYGHPIKSLEVFEALYKKTRQNSVAYYFINLSNTLLQPLDEDTFENVLYLIPKAEISSSIENYYAALIHISDNSFVEALEFLNATIAEFLPAQYLKVFCLAQLGRNTDSAVENVLKAEKNNINTLNGGYLKDFDIDTCLQFDANWHKSIYQYAHFEEISEAVYLVLNILAEDEKERCRFYEYHSMFGENSLLNDFKMNQSFQTNLSKKENSDTVKYNFEKQIPLLNVKEREAIALNSAIALENIEKTYSAKIINFDKINHSNEGEYIEETLASWIEKRNKMHITQEQIGELLYYFSEKDKLNKTTIFYLHHFAELNYTLDAKAQKLEKGKFWRWLIKYIAKKGAKKNSSVFYTSMF